MKAFIFCSGLLALLVTAIHLPARTAFGEQGQNEDLAACLQETDDRLRLACFDRIAAGVATRHPPAEAPVTDAVIAPAEAPAPAAIESTPADQPAAAAIKTAPATPASTPTPAAVAGPPPTPEDPSAASATGTSSSVAAMNSGDFTAVVRKIDVQPRGEHIVFLDNGEVWQQNEKTSFFPVAVGDSVTIRERRFGGHRLITESGRAYAVKQIR